MMTSLLLAASIVLALVPFSLNQSGALKLVIRSNVEVVAAPDCLGKLVAVFPIAVLPEPEGNLSKMEFGPFDEAERYAAVLQIRKVGCVVTYKTRACRTPGTDLNFCDASIKSS